VVDWFATSEGAGDLSLLLVVSNAHRPIPIPCRDIRQGVLGRAHTTNLPVNDLYSAIEKLDWYAQRWKIETFHQVLKSGCRAEDAKQRTAERLTNMLAVLCIIAWRVFSLTIVNRTNAASPPSTVFTSTEINILNHLAGQTPISGKRRISHYLMIVAKLDGYLARGHDPPPGNMVLWVHPALWWVEVQAAAVEEDGGLEVFAVSVATHSTLDSHDLAVDSFGHRVGDSVCAVANHIRQSLLNGLGNLLQGSQRCMDHPFVPIFEKDGGRGCICMMPKVT
jgi:hypothetical protein